MGKLGVLVIVILFGWNFTSSAESKSVEKASSGGDVCDLRPDLCGGAAVKKKSKTTAAQVANESEDKKFGDDDDLEQELNAEPDLPAVRKARSASRAQAAPVAKRSGSYSAYLQQNANHPALSAKRKYLNQIAFVESKRAAAIVPASGQPGVAGSSGNAGSAGTPGTSGTPGATGGPAAASPGSAAAAGIAPASGIGSAPGIGSSPGIAPASGVTPASGSSSSSGGYSGSSSSSGSSDSSSSLPAGSEGSN